MHLSNLKPNILDLNDLELINILNRIRTAREQPYYKATKRPKVNKPKLVKKDKVKKLNKHEEALLANPKYRELLKSLITKKEVQPNV